MREVSAWLRTLSGRVEFNIEGDPRPDLLALVHEVQADPVHARAGAPGRDHQSGRLVAGYASRRHDRRRATAAQAEGIRVSLFVDPEDAPIRWAADIGADRVELYTEPFARAFERGDAAGRASFELYAAGRGARASLGLGVNAGHDLDLENLTLFRRLPHLDEVSIGHALISHALFVGLDRSVRDYLGCAGRELRSGFRLLSLGSRLEC